MSVEGNIKVLEMKLASFIQTLIGTRPFITLSSRRETIRERLRNHALKVLALTLASHHAEHRPHNEVLAECQVRYGAQVDEWVEQNLDLIAEIKMEAGDQP